MADAVIVTLCVLIGAAMPSADTITTTTTLAVECTVNADSVFISLGSEVVRVEQTRFQRSDDGGQTQSLDKSRSANLCDSARVVVDSTVVLAPIGHNVFRIASAGDFSIRLDGCGLRTGELHGTVERRLRSHKVTLQKGYFLLDSVTTIANRSKGRNAVDTAGLKPFW